MMAELCHSDWSGWTIKEVVEHWTCCFGLYLLKRDRSFRTVRIHACSGTRFIEVWYNKWIPNFRL